MKKLFSALMLTFLLSSLSTLAFNLQPVKADGTIYIKADGSVDPPTAPIQRDGDIYTFTDNIYDRIGVRRSNIIIDGNGFTLNGSGVGGPGFRLSGINNVTVQNTNIEGFEYGVYLHLDANSNTFSSNNIVNNVYGVDLYRSSFNTFIDNNITNNGYFEEWTGYGWGISLLLSNNNNVSGNNITDNYSHGFHIISSSSNIVSGNDIRDNHHGLTGGYGVYIHMDSNNNIVSGNHITDNSWGVFSVSSNNRIYHNNFINNGAYVSGSFNNTWDDGYPFGGNYWSVYDGTDTDRDGIGDTPYIINANNQDNYPLMAPFSVFDAGTWNGISYSVDVVSNSTVSDFYFNPDDGAFIRFNVTGRRSTGGFSRVAIPKQLLWVENGWVVLVGDTPVVPTVTEDTDHTYLYFTYSHSTKTVLIQGTQVIPEFPLNIILPLFVVATLIAATVYSRKKE